LYGRERFAPCGATTRRKGEDGWITPTMALGPNNNNWVFSARRHSSGQGEGEALELEQSGPLRHPGGNRSAESGALRFRSALLLEMIFRPSPLAGAWWAAGVGGFISVERAIHRRYPRCLRATRPVLLGQDILHLPAAVRWCCSSLSRTA
jgi:hypothetical protein